MKENKEIILNLNALVKKINKNRKRLCSLFVFLIVFVGLLITTQEDVYAGIATYLPRTAGFCKIRVFVDGTYRSSYTLNCKLLTDMKSEEEMADLKWTFG